MEALKLKGLQPVWDKTIIDEVRTTADLSVCEPAKKETVFVADKPWEAGMAHYANVIRVDGKYRMYYLTHGVHSKKTVAGRKDTIDILDTYVCYAESTDGLHWKRPSVGLYEYEGSYENNIILRSIDKPGEEDFFDNFFVFIDENPACPPEKKYKATAHMCYYRLGWYSSPDGIH